MCESNKILIRPVNNSYELEEIYKLRYENYLGKGYILKNPKQILTDEWDESSCATHFVAIRKGQVIGTVRLIIDSPKGLPMERIFPEEIANLKKGKRKIAEASALVTVKEDCKSNERLWLRLSKVVWEEAETRQIDDLCIAVTENHLGFYKRLMFETIGKSKHYRSLNDVLAYPVRLQVREARVKDRLHGHNNDRSFRKSFLGKSRAR